MVDLRTSNISGPSAAERIIKHLDSDPRDACSIITVLDADKLTLSTRHVLINSEGQVVGIAGHSLTVCSTKLRVLGIIGIDLRDLAALMVLVNS